MTRLLAFFIAALTMPPLAVLAQTDAAAPAQSATEGSLDPGAFESANAILDTSIPFALGAVESEQSLRGAFGWATFQEGLVLGSYFRFDPDGYARFSPNPRLDIDVFEVICRPRTYTCMARKDGISVFLTDRFEARLEFSALVEGDRFYLSKGVSEFQLPPDVMQPLSRELELLLATGGHLVIRRGEQEAARISIEGFFPALAFLRWVAARQDYSVLPPDWPVPNARSPALAQAPNTWVQTRPDPQQMPITGEPDQTTQPDLSAQLAALQAQIAALSPASTAQTAAEPAPQPAWVATPIAGNSPTPLGTAPHAAPPQGYGQAMPMPAMTPQPHPGVTRLNPAQSMAYPMGFPTAYPAPSAPRGAPMPHASQFGPDLAPILADLAEALRGLRNPPDCPQENSIAALPAPQNDPILPADKRRYLTEVIGLTPMAAETVLATGRLPPTQPTPAPAASPSPSVEDLVRQILQEFEAPAERPGVDPGALPASDAKASEAPPSEDPSMEEYLLLEDYFRAASPQG